MIMTRHPTHQIVEKLRQAEVGTLLIDGGADQCVVRKTRGQRMLKLHSIGGSATPMIFVAVVAPNVEEQSPERRKQYLHYGKVYMRFIRPLIDKCKRNHHAPIEEDQSVNDGDLFAVEFANPDKTKAWAGTRIHRDFHLSDSGGLAKMSFGQYGIR